MHLVSCEMPAFETITRATQSIDPTFEGGHFVDVSSGNFFFPRNDPAVFARSQDLASADITVYLLSIHRVPMRHCWERSGGCSSGPRQTSRKAHGIVLTPLLAQLNQGDLAAVLNADSYMTSAVGMWNFIFLSFVLHYHADCDDTKAVTTALACNLNQISSFNRDLTMTDMNSWRIGTISVLVLSGMSNWKTLCIRLNLLN